MNISTSSFHWTHRPAAKQQSQPTAQFVSPQFTSSLSPEAAAAERKRMQDQVMNDPIQRSIVEMAEQKAANINIDLAKLAPDFEMRFERPSFPLNTGIVVRDGRYGYFSLTKKKNHQFGDSALKIKGVKNMLKAHGMGEYKVSLNRSVTYLTIDGFVLHA
jgi:hypothetical protein